MHFFSSGDGNLSFSEFVELMSSTGGCDEDDDANEADALKRAFKVRSRRVVFVFEQTLLYRSAPIGMN